MVAAGRQQAQQLGGASRLCREPGTLQARKAQGLRTLTQPAAAAPPATRLLLALVSHFPSPMGWFFNYLVFPLLVPLIAAWLLVARALALASPLLLPLPLALGRRLRWAVPFVEDI